MKDDSEKRYWFTAKRYGWGWGLPSAWQGWIVLAAFIGVLSILPLIFDPRAEVAFFIASVVVVAAILFAICWVKGEPPKWRWGGSGKD